MRDIDWAVFAIWVLVVVSMLSTLTAIVTMVLIFTQGWVK